MKSFQYIFLLLLSSVWLPSCETSVDASGLFDQQQLVVINGFLSPQDTILKVRVSNSISKVNSINTNVLITDATVTIANESNDEVTLTYNAETFNYEALVTDLPIIAGKKYFLTVMAQGKEYKASCLIPVEQVGRIEQDIRVEARDDFFGNREMKLTIADINDQSNYYIIGADVRFSFSGGVSNATQVDFDFNKFVTDTNRENTVVNADGLFFLPDDAEVTTTVIKVANNEKILYDALRAEFLNNYNDGDPFAEPVIAPTNIVGENGFGVFAGYQLTEKEVTF